MHTRQKHAHLAILLDGVDDEFGEGIVVNSINHLIRVDAVRLVHPQPHQLRRLLYCVARREQNALRISFTVSRYKISTIMDAF